MITSHKHSVRLAVYFLACQTRLVVNFAADTLILKIFFNEILAAEKHSGKRAVVFACELILQHIVEENKTCPTKCFKILFQSAFAISSPTKPK